VLFDGRNTDNLQGAKVTPDGLLLAGLQTKMPVDAFRLHLEFRTPYMPQARGQGRGNSGVYIQQRYEVQILDSFGLEGAENECGGLYKQTRPDVNMCLPPLAWQTYDIWFTPPKFDEAGKKTANARVTALHNGYLIHHHREITAKTGGGKAEGPQSFPINLQDHGNPVMFRNIWIVPAAGDEDYSLSRYATRYLRDGVQSGQELCQ
jgi:3-keto-disaccharide hydrolase